MLHRFHPRAGAAGLLCALASCAMPASAQSAADARAPAPPTRYQSTIGYRVEPAPDDSPDRLWARANATVAATNSMALTMPMPMPMPAAPAQAAPAGKPAPAPTQGHDHHPMEHP